MKLHTQHIRFVRLTLVLLSLATAFALAWTSLQNTSKAADMSKFDPGNIMSDAVMSNKDSMNVQQIQAFLDSKNACNNTNTYMASWYPHLQYTIRDGKFVCMAKDSFNGKSAAQIIWQAGQDYAINPQFLIVLLEKEQGLITDTWPNNIQYRSATGFGCPDTAACDSQYFGLENQIRNAANLFRTVLSGGWSNYPVGQTYVQFHPNASCGGTVVNVQNRATSALYRYTPYQPNRSALNAGYGKGDSCGAYGNRNTWGFFNDWFGDPTNNMMIPLDDPRWMEINTTTKKVDIYTKEEVGPTIEKGAQAKFVDKIYINGKWIARTQWDRDNNNLHGFLVNEISDIKYEDITPAWMVVNTDTNKRDFLRDKNTGFTRSRSLAKFVDKATINGKTYFRTEYEKDNNRSRGYLSDTVEDYRLYDFQKPRFMIAKKDTSLIQATSRNVIRKIPKGSILYFDKLIIINSAIYSQPVTEAGTDYVVNSEDFDETNQNPFFNFKDPRVMQTKTSTQKVDMKTGKKFGTNYNPETQFKFTDQIRVNGEWYARTEQDKLSGDLHGLLVSELEELSPTAVPTISTTLKNRSYKIDPIRGIKYENLTSGAPAILVDRIEVLGKTFYRTGWENSQNRPRYIPAEDINLENFSE